MLVLLGKYVGLGSSSVAVVSREKYRRQLAKTEDGTDKYCDEGGISVIQE